MRKKVLILEDRFQLKDRLTNLGDQALFQGLHNIIEKKFDCEIMMSDVKPFPYFTFNRLRKEASLTGLESTFDNWFNIIINYSTERAKNEKKSSCS